jgi:hypothetical protein
MSNVVSLEDYRNSKIEEDQGSSVRAHMAGAISAFCEEYVTPYCIDLELDFIDFYQRETGLSVIEIAEFMRLDFIGQFSDAAIRRQFEKFVVARLTTKRREAKHIWKLGQVIERRLEEIDGQSIVLAAASNDAQIAMDAAVSAEENFRKAKKRGFGSMFAVLHESVGDAQKMHAACLCYGVMKSMEAGEV